MPTISNLPVADGPTAEDLLPISQGGSVHAISVGQLLAGAQPAIIVSPPCLLGRVSIGPGGPDSIEVGDGLVLARGTLTATMQNGMVIQDLSNLSAITALSPDDLIAVNQAGRDHAITYGNFLDGVTIDSGQAAAPASDSDVFWVAQTSNIMVRQTLAALWPWIAGKLSTGKQRVIELNADTTLLNTTHNNALLVCSGAVTITGTLVNLTSGFSCEVINASSGQVTLSPNIITGAGSNTLAPQQACRIYCVSYSAGSIIYASINGGSSGASLIPGQVTGVTATSVTAASVTVTWTAPASGGIVSSYVVQYRASGTGPWSAAGQTNGTVNFQISGLQASTSYDVTVAAANSAGTGPSSSTLVIATSSGGTVPGVVTGISITNVAQNTATVTWNAPATGGAGVLYQVQFRLSGQTAWTTASGNIPVTFFNLTSLSVATSYDVQIVATNTAGSGPSSAIVTFLTNPAVGLVSSIIWNVVPAGSFAHGTGALGVNAHVNPASAAVQFGLSGSSTIQPASWIAGVYVNTDLWGAFIPTPAQAGSWYFWASGVDGSTPAVFPTPITVT